MNIKYILKTKDPERNKEFDQRKADFLSQRKFPLAEEILAIVENPVYRDAEKINGIILQQNALTALEASNPAPYLESHRGGHFNNSHLMLQNLSDRCMDGSIFSGIMGRGTNFEKSSVKGGDFKSAYLASANFKYGQLQSASLTGSFCEGINFVGAELQNADLSYCNLNRASFTNAILQLAILNGSNLDRANLKGADMSMVKAIGAYIGQYSFWDTNLTMANFESSYMPFVNLGDSELFRTNFNNAFLEGASFAPSILKEDYMSLKENETIEDIVKVKKLDGCTFNYTDLRDVRFTNVDLTDIDLSTANLDRVTFNDNTIWNLDEVSKQYNVKQVN